MTQQAQNDHYADERSLALAYAEAVNEELRDLKAAGADVVQIDEPYLQARPEPAREYAVEAINRALDGDRGRHRPPHLLRLRAHRPRPARRLPVPARAERLPRDAPLARGGAAGSRPGGAARASPTRRSCSACSTWARAEAETPEVVAERIRRALAVVPPERLVVAPDCGMKYLPRERAFGKLEAMVAGARLVREELGVAMQIGRPGEPVSHISQAYPDRVEVRGRDLSADLMGRLSFTEYFHLLLTGREPTEDQRFFLDLLLVAIAEHGMMPIERRRAHDARGRPGVAPGRGRGRDPRRRLGRPRHVGGVRAAARRGAGAVVAGGEPAAVAGDVARGIHASGGKVPGFGHPVHRPLDPRAERILELADARGVSGPHVALARHFRDAVAEVWGKPLTMNVSLPIAAVMLDLGLSVGRREGRSDPRAHGRPARSSGRGAGASASASCWRGRRRRRSSTSATRAGRA